MSRVRTRQQWRAHFRGESAVRPIAKAAERDTSSQDSVSSLKEQANTAAGTLRIRIEELELRGVERLDEGQVAAALQTELKTLIAAKGVPRSWGRDQMLERVDASPAVVAKKVTAAWLGSQVGRTIYNLQKAERR